MRQRNWCACSAGCSRLVTRIRPSNGSSSGLVIACAESVRTMRIPASVSPPPCTRLWCCVCLLSTSQHSTAPLRAMKAIYLYIYIYKYIHIYIFIYIHTYIHLDAGTSTGEAGTAAAASVAHAATPSSPAVLHTCTGIRDHISKPSWPTCMQVGQEGGARKCVARCGHVSNNA